VRGEREGDINSVGTFEPPEDEALRPMRPSSLSSFLHFDDLYRSLKREGEERGEREGDISSVGLSYPQKMKLRPMRPSFLSSFSHLDDLDRSLKRVDGCCL
jgi:hypothetical protein